MTFVNPNASNPAPVQSSNQGDQKRNTLAYLNLYVELEDGTRVKLVPDLTLRMFEEREVDKQLVDAVKAGAFSLDQLQRSIKVEVSLARDKDTPFNFKIAAP